MPIGRKDMTIRQIFRSSVAVAALSLAAATAQAADLRIAIANFGEHPQLAQASEGFRAALAEAGYTEGDKVEFIESHTNFDTTLLPQMIAKLQADNPDLLYTITTPVSQVAKSATEGSGLPIVFGAVTDPVAAKLVPSWEAGDATMTGASDLQDIPAILAFTRKLFPDAKRLGLPYNPGEANDVALLEIVTAAAGDAGFEVVGVGVDSVNDIQQRIASLAGKVDVIYVPTSNLIQPALPAVAAAARQVEIPIVNATNEGVKEGIVAASFAVDYAQVGKNAGMIAAKVLDGTAPADIAPVTPAYEDHHPQISKSAMAAIGAEIPADLADCGCIMD